MTVNWEVRRRRLAEYHARRKGMSMIDPESHLHTAIKLHRKKLQRQEWEAASKEKRSNGVPSEVEIVSQQITDNESSFYDEHEPECRCAECVSSAIDAAEGEGY